jgi:hypothetical protein
MKNQGWKYYSMSGDEEYGSIGDWIELNDFIRDKCGKSIDLFGKDDSSVCSRYGKQFCNDFENRYKNDEDFNTIYGDCYDEERHPRIDLDICNVIVFAGRKNEHRKRRRTDTPYDWIIEHNNLRYILGLLLSVIMASINMVDIAAGLPKVERK